MERDGKSRNSTDEAGLAPTENPQTAGVIPGAASAAQIQVKDFSPAPPQDDDVAEKQKGLAWESLGADPTPAPLPADSGPGFVDVNGDVGGSGHNETVVDIIAVPCPGADPINTWTFGHETSGDASTSGEMGSRSSSRRPGPWVTKNLRMAASIARVSLYRHRALEDGMTLKSLAEDLLDQVERIRDGAVRLLLSCPVGLLC
jgi:hypothetical protein